MKEFNRFQGLIECLTWPLLVSWSMSKEHSRTAPQRKALVLYLQHQEACDGIERYKKIWITDEEQGSTGPLPAGFTSYSISGNGGTIWSCAAQVNQKSTQALTNLFFSLMQKQSERQTETLAVLEEIHPAMELSNVTNQHCFSGCDRVFPHWVM